MRTDGWARPLVLGSKLEFLKAMERFGLPVRGKGRPGIGGLTEDVVLALFDRCAQRAVELTSGGAPEWRACVRGDGVRTPHVLAAAALLRVLIRRAALLPLLGRYDTDQSGTLSFREFSTAFLQRHQERSEPMPAEEYKAPPKAYKAGFEGEPMDDTELRHLKARPCPPAHVHACAYARTPMAQRARPHAPSERAHDDEAPFARAAH
jgi:hypothetical protein